jgi:hypothetical protein
VPTVAPRSRRSRFEGQVAFAVQMRLPRLELWVLRVDQGPATRLGTRAVIGNGLRPRSAQLAPLHLSRLAPLPCRAPHGGTALKYSSQPDRGRSRPSGSALPTTYVPWFGRPAESYGSESWGFESLRAHSFETATTPALTCGNAGQGRCRRGLVTAMIARTPEFTPGPPNSGRKGGVVGNLPPGTGPLSALWSRRFGTGPVMIEASATSMDASMVPESFDTPAFRTSIRP